jgi:3-oxoacyl-[acyl-carrier-protein] synthase II
VLSFLQAGHDREVLITGTGAVCPLGIGVQSAWQRLLSGPSACRRLLPDELSDRIPLDGIPGLRHHGAPVDHQQISRLCQRLSAVQRLPDDSLSAMLNEPVLAMTAVALEEALQQSGLQLPCSAPERMAVLFGGSKGGLATAENLLRSLRRPRDQPDEDDHWQSSRAGSSMTSGITAREAASRSVATRKAREAKAFAAAFQHAFSTDCASRLVSRIVEAEGPALCPVAACATGLISVLQGAAMIHAGLCDVCITGSADAALRSSVLASFHRLQVLSRNPDAATACRPFDVARDGFVIGDGAAVLILESRRHARRRGARPLAQVLGGGWLSDPTGMTQMNESGETVSELLLRCCSTTGVFPGVLSLHGTGTETNDLVEARGILQALGDRLPVCFGTKGATGHLLGAAGSVETALLTAGLVAGCQPGTRNLKEPDPRCWIPLALQPGPVSANAVWGKLSLGFGGHVACGLFSSPRD